MKLKTVFILALFAISTSLSACATLLKEPKAQIKNIEVSKLSIDGGELKLLCEVENPNGVDLTIDSLNYTLTLNEKPISSSEVSEATKLPANGKVTVTIPVKFKYSDVFASIADLVSQKPLSYSVKGQAKMGLFTLPFEKKGEVKLKE